MRYIRVQRLSPGPWLRGAPRARPTGTGAQERALEAARPGARCPQEREEGRQEQCRWPAAAPVPTAPVPSFPEKGSENRRAPSRAGQAPLLGTQEAMGAWLGGRGGSVPLCSAAGLLLRIRRSYGLETRFVWLQDLLAQLPI